MRRYFSIRRLIIGCAISSLWSVSAVHADHEFFPDPHELFAPLEADPRDLQYALRLVTPVGHHLLGEAAIGDYLGLYRWALPWAGGYAQVSGGGGVFSRFDLSQRSDDMLSSDFLANLPLDWRAGRWSGRFMLYHTSSHLGDDYLKTRGGQTTKHSWDNLRWLLSFDPTPVWRLYGGYTYTFRTLPEGVGRNALQGGIEWSSHRFNHDHFQWYWANDYQAWERSHWNPGFNSQLGFRVAKSREDRRGIAFFVEFGAGRQAQGQFYNQSETHWNLGTKFHLS
jgi:hypothetical protein